MPFTVTYDQTGFVHAKYEGNLDMPGIRAMLAAAAECLKENNCIHVLADYRDAHLGVSIADLYELPKLILQRGRAMGISVYQIRRALIIPAAVYKAFQFFETVSRNNMQNVKIFTDEDSAREWLMQEDS